jgi:putative transcriptional regulator
MKLKEITAGLCLTGVEPTQIVSVVTTVPLGDGALQLIYRMPDDIQRVGVLNERTHEKITVRHLGRRGGEGAQPISGKEISSRWERARSSQAVFARYLNLTVAYISQLERGAKQPIGAALVPLNVIRRKSIEAVL